MRPYALGALLLPAGCVQPPPEPLLVLPEFSMSAVEGAGERPFGRDDLLGTVWLVDFVFTRCDGPCPLLSRRFQDLQPKLPRGARLLSVSVDPGYDTAPRLREYASLFGADPGRWLFLRGSTSETYQLLFAGFRVPFSTDPKAPAGSRVQHSTRLALVDKKAGVRRFYDGVGGTDDPIVRDVLKLLEER